MAATTIPILPSRDFDETVVFYTSLGFTETGRWPEEYLILSRDGDIELHFWWNPHEEPATNDVACYIRFDTAHEAQQLYDEWEQLGLPGAGMPRLQAPATADYGLLEFALVDPHGCLLRIGGRLDSR